MKLLIKTYILSVMTTILTCFSLTITQLSEYGISLGNEKGIWKNWPNLPNLPNQSLNFGIKRLPIRIAGLILPLQIGPTDQWRISDIKWLPLIHGRDLQTSLTLRWLTLVTVKLILKCNRHGYMASETAHIKYVNNMLVSGIMWIRIHSSKGSTLKIYNDDFLISV